MSLTRHTVVLVALSLFAAGCTSATATGPPASIDPDTVQRGEVRDFGPAPVAPEGPFDAQLADAVQVLTGQPLDGIVFADEVDAIDVLGASGDPRVGWILSDLLGITREPGDASRLANAATELLGMEFTTFAAWGDLTDHLIAWDIPAPPGYVDIKRAVLTSIVPEWEPFFDEGADIDWRYVSWGGVRIDDRPYDTTDDPCSCIPAADNPEVSSALDAAWLTDDAVVFGVEINGESRAYPRQIMEVREMVNDTLGGRDFAMPYCTLCGSAQVWFTDEVPDGVERPILRTSGLLSRSNKVMYDLNTFSIFDTFLGDAKTGLLAEIGVQLTQHSVVTSTWAAWRGSHPETTVLTEDLALGRDFDFRNGRDADGPIFPIGDVDARLPVQEDVLGVITPDGTPLAVHVAAASEALGRGETIEIDGVRVVADGSGIRALAADGTELPGHQAFWFAWSQFYPDTQLWPKL